ncbi:RNA methyltransferase [Ornithinibacillus gellani]|uniref:TrmH family RNA methyltransferase n=1 Tax=Ornithinibacillus gellani TaxID=2293253 RepID=UPI000F49A718|nr:RNA methyltransferase [Ornithinibacillus gellani]TQS76218.1 RNA methyltransferase [Ornithinibacillus gellani]
MITSIQNEHVKAWRKLHKRKYRQQTNTFLIEGFHLLEEAWKSDWEIIEVMVREDIILPALYQSIPAHMVTEQVFQHISQTQQPQGIAALVKMKQEKVDKWSRVLLLDAIQDPGNVGTMIRTADAADFDAVILGEGTVDLYNDKVIRSTQGSIFHIPVLHQPLQDAVKHLKEDGFSVWAAVLEESKDYRQVQHAGKTAILIGNEGAGIQQLLQQEASERVHIPIPGHAESLNASIAAAILMYHVID